MQILTRTNGLDYIIDAHIYYITIINLIQVKPPYHIILYITNTNTVEYNILTS